MVSRRNYVEEKSTLQVATRFPGRDKNTNTAILSVIDELESGVLRKGYGAVVLLDIEGAF